MTSTRYRVAAEGHRKKGCTYFQNRDYEFIDGDKIEQGGGVKIVKHFTVKNDYCFLKFTSATKRELLKLLNNK